MTEPCPLGVKSIHPFFFFTTVNPCFSASFTSASGLSTFATTSVLLARRSTLENLVERVLLRHRDSRRLALLGLRLLRLRLVAHERKVVRGSARGCPRKGRSR